MIYGQFRAKNRYCPAGRPKTANAFGRIDAVTHYHALQDRDFLQSVIEGASR